MKHQDVMKKLLQRIEQETYPDKLPSVRSLMAEFQVSQATVSQALRQLVELKKVYPKKNVGYYVYPQKKKATSQQAVFDFSTTSTSWVDFPLDSYAQCLTSALTTEQAEFFRYGPVAGNPELKGLFQQLLAAEQLYFKQEQLIITSGTQQALHLLALTLKATESFLIEQPTYHLIIQLLERLSIQHATFDRQLDRIEVDQLEKAIVQQRPKYLFLMPRFHNPLGTTMTDTEKKAILKLAVTYDFYIIEDDYLSDFERDSKYRTMFELDQHHRVIYLKSFSKIMFPGQRLGLVILPEELVEPFTRLKEVTDIHTNALTQMAMQTFIKSGLYAYHRDKIAERHQEKAAILRKSCQDYLPNVVFPNNQQMHTVIELSPRTNMDKLYHELEKRHVRVDTHHENYVKNYQQKRKFLRLNTTSIANDQIASGVGQIVAAIEQSRSF